MYYKRDTQETQRLLYAIKLLKGTLHRRNEDWGSRRWERLSTSYTSVLYVASAEQLHPEINIAHLYVYKSISVQLHLELHLHLVSYICTLVCISLCVAFIWILSLYQGHLIIWLQIWHIQSTFCSFIL